MQPLPPSPIIVALACVLALVSSLVSSSSLPPRRHHPCPVITPAPSSWGLVACGCGHIQFPAEALKHIRECVKVAAGTWVHGVWEETSSDRGAYQLGLPQSGAVQFGLSCQTSNLSEVRTPIAIYPHPHPHPREVHKLRMCVHARMYEVREVHSPTVAAAVRHPRGAAWNFLIELADVQSRWWQRDDLFWREREHGLGLGHGFSSLLTASWSPLVVESSPRCRRSRGRRHCRHVGVVFMVVSLRHRSRSRGRVIGASLHWSSLSLTLPPHIDIITESTEVAELPVVDDGFSGWKSQEDEVVVVGEELVELIELVEVVLDVDELYEVWLKQISLTEELKIEEDDEREAIKLESEETCGEGVGEGEGLEGRGEEVGPITY
ncbi:hypothetical protein EDB89DRAFT_1915091 [Lactarius sanguifluus]|nr:hypothetical protein EDB89DRAFT_1915091 [Lactarius sanguifluus]